jgi:glucan biosynthesis protein C
MILGINYHVAAIYLPGHSWRVSSSQESPFFFAIQSFIHSFRMEAFYILSGFFFLLIVEKYGHRRALLDRASRLGIPLIVVGCTLNLLTNAYSGRMAAPIGLAYFLRGQWLDHLWFIANLIVYCVLALPVARFFADSARPAAGPIEARMLYLVILLVSVTSAVLVTVGLHTFSGVILFVTLGSLYRYAPYFLLGMWMWRHRSSVLDMLGYRRCLVFAGAYVLLRLAVSRLGIETMSWTLAQTLLQIGNSLASLVAIGALNSAGRRSEFVNLLVDASYSIYLLHVPLIVGLFLAFQWDRLNLFAAYALLCVLVFTTCLVLHVALVRRFAPLRFLLNGRL